jgi:hypothetical protein
MPMIQTLDWETVHSWDSNRWDNGEWTNDKMQDELEELDKFREKNLSSFSLIRLVNTILEDGSVRKGNTIYDFRDLQRVFKSWNHLTTTCDNYICEWIAQDESHLKCRFNRECNHFKIECPDYGPMVAGMTLEELAKGEKVEFT